MTSSMLAKKRLEITNISSELVVRKSCEHGMMVRKSCQNGMMVRKSCQHGMMVRYLSHFSQHGNLVFNITDVRQRTSIIFPNTTTAVPICLSRYDINKDNSPLQKQVWHFPN